MRTRTSKGQREGACSERSVAVRRARAIEGRVSTDTSSRRRERSEEPCQAESDVRGSGLAGRLGSQRRASDFKTWGLPLAK